MRLKWRFKSLVGSLALILMTYLGSGFEYVHAARILFVGNSFTGYSETILREFSSASPFGEDELGFQFVGGTNLEAHSNRRRTLNSIRNGHWDYIVLQDHSLWPLIEFGSFRYGVETLVAEAKASGAQPILFQTYARGRGGNLDNFDFHQFHISERYTQAGIDFDVPVSRVGDVWREIKRVDPILFNAMYREDLIHPTLIGTYAIACSLYKTIYDTNLAWAPTYYISASSSAKIRKAAISLNTTIPLYTNPANLPEPDYSFLASILNLLLD